MRQPTFSRSRRHTRSYRLARTGIAVAVVVVLAALIANLFGGDGKKEEEVPLAHVSFAGPVNPEGDTRMPPKRAVAAEKKAIIEMLNDWFQKGFVDPDEFAEGDLSNVGEHFADEAQAEFKAQLNTLTIGDARLEVDRVDPQVARSSMSIYFDKGKDPKFATVRIVFSAVAKMKEKAPNLRVVMSGLFTLEKQGDDWKVKYWSDVKQTQNSIQTSPTPTT